MVSEAPLWRRRAGLHLARKLAVERRHRHRGAGEMILRHRRQEIDVALHERRFGDHGYRMAELLQHFKDAAGQVDLALDRLIAVGVHTGGNRLRLVGRLRQFGAQQLRRILLDEDAAFEIEPGRQAEIGMRRTGEAIDAAVLAAAIGIDRAVEADIGRVVARYHGLRHVAQILRLQVRHLGIGAAPAVIDRDMRAGFEPASHAVLIAPRPLRGCDGSASSMRRLSALF